MRLFFFQTAASIAMLFAIAVQSSLAVSQEHFIGEGQAVNRVIKLRSQPTAPPAQKISKETSRGNRVARQTTTSNPTQIKYDNLQPVPRALQDQRGPVVEERGPLNQSFVPKRGPAKTPAVSSSWAKPSSARSTPSSALARAKEMVTKQSNMIVTEITSPRYVNINETAQVKVNVFNKGAEAVENVKLIATIPLSTKLTSSSPQATHTEGQNYEFSIQRIGGDDVRQIVLNLVPTNKTPLEIDTQVRVDSRQKTMVSVRQPELVMTLSGPLQANIGQTIVHQLIVSNTGDGVAKNVRLDTLFPAEIKTISQSAGPAIRSIEPGKSVKINYESQALAPGAVGIKVTANAAGVKTKQASADLKIFQPELRISAMGPKVNFVERDGIYTVKIENTGEVDVTNIKVSLAVPQGMKVTTISRQAGVDATNGILNWTYDRIPAKTTEQIQLKATALQEGQQTCSIIVSSNETREKEIVLGTKVITRADLGVRIRNVSGPVQVGGTAEFVVEVENKGSRKASDVNVRVLLPESLMASKGTDVDSIDNAVIFGEPQISPGEKATFKFTAVGVSAGEHIVRSILEIGGTERKMIAEDSVFIYDVDEARVSESLSPVVPR